MCATPNCQMTLTFSDAVQGRTKCVICMKREELQSAETPPVIKIEKPVVLSPVKGEVAVPKGKQEVAVEPQLPKLRRSNSMSKIHSAADYVVASLRVKATGMKGTSYFGEFSSDPKKRVKRTPEYAEMFSQTKLDDQKEYEFPYDKEEWAISCDDAEAQLLNFAFLKVKNIITWKSRPSRIDVEIHTNKGPCNGCKNRIERAGVAWAKQLTNKQELFVMGYYLQGPFSKVRGNQRGEEGGSTDYGILGREPEVSYGASSKENGLYVIQYWPRK